MNVKVYRLLASGVSQRRTAKLLKIHLVTVARKLEYLGLQARHKNFSHRQKLRNKITEMQFDDLETLEHTKLKPLSITIAVEKHSRKIIGFEVAKMPAKGLLAKRALKKYGFRKDERAAGRDRLFRRIKSTLTKDAIIQSDENPYYLSSVKKHFPNSVHIRSKGLRGCITGQGELKAAHFDPLFSLNHTYAMFRANVNRLFRKTWCTTKKMRCLADHLEIYTHYHNNFLIINRSAIGQIQ